MIQEFQMIISHQNISQEIQTIIIDIAKQHIHKKHLETIIIIISKTQYQINYLMNTMNSMQIIFLILLIRNDFIFHLN